MKLLVHGYQTLLPVKLLRVMRITAAFLLIAALHVSGKVVSQTVSYSGKDVKLEKVFSVIEQQTGYGFFYKLPDLQEAKPVTVNLKNIPLKEALEKILQNQSLQFSIEGNTVVISRILAPAVDLQSTGTFSSPPSDIHGHITDNLGNPLEGASIIMKGSKNGTSTDKNGNFVLKGLSENEEIIISFTGYEQQVVKIKNDLPLQIKLVPENKSLLDVVINKGYYNTTQSLNTGDVAVLKSADIEKQPVSNPLAAMEGRISGVEITQQTGVPGGNFEIRIRGQNSIGNGNDPLYIVDGVPYNSSSMSFPEANQSILFNGTSPLNNLNPSDIESIEVLKDADATSIYGSRGANGVILITTKRGKAGDLRVDLNFYTGAGKVTRKMNLLNTQQYLTTREEAFQNSNFWPIDPALYKYVPDVFIWDSTRTTDWQKELLGGTASITDAQLSVSGGDQNTQFSVGGGYHGEGTVFPGDSYDQRGSAHLSLNSKSLNQRFKISFSLEYARNNTNLIKQDLTTQALTIPSNAPPLYNSRGDLNWGTDFGSDTWVYPYLTNPLSYLKTSYEAENNSLILNSVLSYTLVPGLDLKANLGYTTIGMDAVTLTPLSSLGPTQAPFSQNETIFSNSKFSNWIIEPQLHWKPLSLKGKLDFLIGTTFLAQTQDGIVQKATGFTSEALMKNISAASQTLVGTNYDSKYRYQAGFIRLNYIFRDNLIINATGRRDGSSRFGPGNQFANFGAVGLAWIFSREAFVSNTLKFLSFGKLRASYGTTGNDQIGNYQYLDTYTSSGIYQSIVGLNPVRLANPDFAWETTRKSEVGLELGFINNRIMTMISYYINKSDNQLVGESLPPTAGFGSVQANLPATVENYGLEWEFNSINIQNRNFSWSTSINLSIPRNKLVAFPNLEASSTYANTLVVGQPLSIRKLYNYQGVDSKTGLYQFQDMDGDGQITVLDQQSVRFLGRKYYGGIINSFKYKGFQLDFLFQFVNQTNYNYLSAFGLSPGGGITNAPSFVMNRWRVAGDQSNVQKFTILQDGADAYANLRASTESISDASFIRLKNVYLSYSFDPKAISKLHIQAAKLFLQAQNLLTITHYNGLDPEVGSNSLPALSVLTAGFHITF